MRRIPRAESACADDSLPDLAGDSPVGCCVERPLRGFKPLLRAAKIKVFCGFQALSGKNDIKLQNGC